LVQDERKLNTHLHLLNCLNGTVNLKTGRLQKHSREDYITHLIEVEYDPKAQAPQWEKFLGEIFQANAKLIEYVRRICGYMATGRRNEKFFVIAHGETDTAKSVFIETVAFVLADFAKVALPETFTSTRHNENARRDIAAFKGARLVRVPETEDGDRIARQLVKRITGDEDVRGQGLYKDAFDYLPQFLLWISTNHLPAVPHDDAATWNRIRVIPFLQQFVEVRPGQKAPAGKLPKDRELKQRLRTEAAGILTWIVHGSYDWHRDGFSELPLAVVEATFDYRATQDTVGRFLEDAAEEEFEAVVLRTELHRAYREWCVGEEIRNPLSARAFRVALEERGFPVSELNVGWVFHGLRLSDE
jgi:putative DNA primase/helicase